VSEEHLPLEGDWLPGQPASAGYQGSAAEGVTTARSRVGPKAAERRSFGLAVGLLYTACWPTATPYRDPNALKTADSVGFALKATPMAATTSGVRNLYTEPADLRDPPTYHVDNREVSAVARSLLGRR
jgi:hypothetical protein